MPAFAKPKNALLLLLLVYCAARYQVALSLDNPVFGWRPTDMASIALNYAHNGMRFLYPQVAWGGAGPGYVEMEFPLVPYLTAVLIKLFGFHEALSLVLPLLCGFAIVWTSYCFARRLAGDMAALWAGILTAIIPTLVFLTNTGMWADPPSVLFTALGLYYAYRWSESGEAKELGFAGVAICLSVLLKLTALYAGIPLIYLLYRRLGPTFWRAPITWIFGVGVLLPNVAWYYHSYQLAVEYGNTFGIIAGGTMKFGTKDLVMSSFFYKELLRRVFLYHLTPIGALGFAAGLYKVARTRTPLSIFLFAWLGSIGFYALVAAHGVNGGHYHYFLPFTPVSSIIVGIGFAWLLESRERLPAFLRSSPVLASLALALVFFPNAAYASHRFFGRDRLIDSKMWEQKKETGMLVKRIARPGALIIVCDVQGGHRTKDKSMSPPDVFYFGDKRGWYLAVDWVTVEEVTALAKEGAQYFIVSGQSVDDFRSQKADAYSKLKGSFTSLRDDDVAIIFDLRKPLSG